MRDLKQISRTRLLNATLKVVRAKGYNATRVEDVCAAAELTKGSFFHHFRSKDELALAAIAYWDATTGGFFADAAYHQPADPRERLIAYVDLRRAMLTGPLEDFTCFAGTILQEVHATHPELAAACARNLCGHAGSFEADIREAMARYEVAGEFSAESLAQHIEFTIQGAFILAKAGGGAEAAGRMLDHLRRYLALLFARPRRHPGAVEDADPARLASPPAE